MHKKTRFFCAQVPGEQPAIWGLKASSEIARNAADCTPDAMFFVGFVGGFRFHRTPSFAFCGLRWMPRTICVIEVHGKLQMTN
ncbi:hypothetical protein [Escherichia coli]|uniref:hypothetical protein n=1 Tax=Escherichia coli TaxID=562 RepID=UPI000BE3794A|nr:hypothetical protein [Escherichia coli]